MPLISSQSLNLGGRRGTTDDVATIPLHPSLSSAVLRESIIECLYHRVMSPNDADGMANSLDPDQTAPQSDLGLHCLPRHLSENLGSLR